MPFASTSPLKGPFPCGHKTCLLCLILRIWEKLERKNK